MGEHRSHRNSSRPSTAAVTTTKSSEQWGTHSGRRSFWKRLAFLGAGQPS